MNKKFLSNVINHNNRKILFTPGPASLSSENLEDIRPCFGRGDDEYVKIENSVLKRIKNISGHREIVRLQGAASLALEILTYNFLRGKVLIIKTGFYSDRIYTMSKFAKKKLKNIKKIDYVDYHQIDNLKGSYDWIFACPVETSTGFKIPILNLYKFKKKMRSKLALDATASIGLEKNHHLSDVSAFSSCKGLFGLTGASFIVFNEKPQNEIDSFYLNLFNHLNKKMTGPYHTIYSLNKILKNYNDHLYAVKINKNKFLKKMASFLSYPKENQPLLCTFVKKKIRRKSNKVVLYQSRAKINGSIVCHLGEVHLKRQSKGKILDFIE